MFDISNFWIQLHIINALWSKLTFLFIFACLDSLDYWSSKDILSFYTIKSPTWFNYLCMISIYLNAISISVLFALFLNFSSKSFLSTFLSNYFYTPTPIAGEVLFIVEILIWSSSNGDPFIWFNYFYNCLFI